VGSFCPGIGAGSQIAVVAIRNFLEKFKL